MTTHPRFPLFPGSSLRALFLLSYHKLCVLAYRVVNIIEDTDPRISYIPSVCSIGTLPCNAPWQVMNLTGATNGTVTSTLGPTAASGNLIPQLFLVIRGTSFVLATSYASNATANVTILASSSNVFVSTTFDSSAGSISTVNLPPDQDITLAVTYIPSSDGEPTRLDIDYIRVASPNSSETSVSPIPLPSSSSLPSFIIPAPSTPSATPRPHSSLAQPKGTIVGESLAGFFGLILIIISIYALFRWRRWRRRLSAEVVKMRARDQGNDPVTEDHP